LIKVFSSSTEIVDISAIFNSYRAVVLAEVILSFSNDVIESETLSAVFETELFVKKNKKSNMKERRIMK
jgi:hypothetical protein